MTKSSYTYPHAWSSASITSPSFSLTAAQPYTVCFAIKGDRYKNVRLDVGGIVTEDIYVRTAWQRHVYAFVAPGTGSDTIQWQVGAERGNIYLDQVYIRQGHGAVMRRDFENGIVLVNPAKADATVDLGGTFYRLDGNRAVNDGSELSGSVTVPAQDALILVKPL
jgi:hypothetical protein